MIVEKIITPNELVEEKKGLDSHLIDSAVNQLVTPQKVKPKYLSGEINQVRYSYPTNGLSGLL